MNLFPPDKNSLDLLTDAVKSVQSTLYILNEIKKKRKSMKDNTPQITDEMVKEFLKDYIFPIKQEEVFANWESFRSSQCVSSEVEKEKPFVLTTKDGKDIFIGDDLFVATMQWTVYQHTAKYSDIGYWKQANIFSSLYLANEYVSLNKPCLSVQEIIEASQTGIAENNNWPQEIVCKITIAKLKELAKTKNTRG